MTRHYCLSIILTTPKVFYNIDLEESDKLICKLVEVELRSLKSNGKKKKKEINNIKETTTILLNRHEKAMRAAYHEWTTTYNEEFKSKIGICKEVQNDAIKLNKNLRQLTRKILSKWKAEVEKTREKLRRLDLLNTIVFIEKTNNKG